MSWVILHLEKQKNEPGVYLGKTRAGSGFPDRICVVPKRIGAALERIFRS